MPAWLLPDDIADVLPAQARKIEELRRRCLDGARRYGYELVMPPLVEFADSLFTGTGRDLDVRTFKLTDQMSGKTMGVRADITPQVARIDAHLLNRSGIVRLCYCGPVLHTQAQSASASRELLQFGGELYGHAGLEADIEVLQLALHILQQVRCRFCLLEIGHANILNALISDAALTPPQHDALLTALMNKDEQAVRDAIAPFESRLAAGHAQALVALCTLYGGIEVLDVAARTLPPLPDITRALNDLREVAQALQPQLSQDRISVDLGDFRGYHYYTGVTFAVYGDHRHGALLRGGRYDEVGQAFGRARPAVGFSLDLKQLADVADVNGDGQAIRAPWAQGDAALAAVIAQLRAAGETVVYALPGHVHQPDEFSYDRELVQQQPGGAWVVKPIS
jgi:ATP phosphoribosyltransferase regulatory subunit